MDFLRLRDKAILVTGASAGIGRSIALEASRHGARIALAGRDPARLESVRADLAGSDHITISQDLSDLDAIAGVVKQSADALGKLDGLVHAAGVHATIPLRATTPQSIARIFEVNVSAAIMLAKAFRHRQVRGPEASIVFLSSAVGVVGQAGVSTYSASKGAILALTRSLALELAKEGVRVNCVCPGVVRTEMTESLKDAIGDTSFEQVVASHPMGLGDPTDVSNAALFLLSSAARWVTGAALSVDGGYTAQ